MRILGAIGDNNHDDGASAGSISGQFLKLLMSTLSCFIFYASD
jgi:hypothetical protein